MKSSGQLVFFFRVFVGSALCLYVISSLMLIFALDFNDDSSRQLAEAINNSPIKIKQSLFSRKLLAVSTFKYSGSSGSNQTNTTNTSDHQSRVSLPNEPHEMKSAPSAAVSSPWEDLWRVHGKIFGENRKTPHDVTFQQPTRFRVSIRHLTTRPHVKSMLSTHGSTLKTHTGASS